jgi:nitrous oxidase accessory protein NosD
MSAIGIGFTLSATYATAAYAAVVPAVTIVVNPGQSIQAAVNRAQPGDTVLLKPGVYRQSVQIRTDQITLRGSGDSSVGTVLVPPARMPHNICRRIFPGTGVCVVAKVVNSKTGAVGRRVYGDTITDLRLTGFRGSGVFGYGTYGLSVTNVSALHDGDYGISRFESTKTLFADDVAAGNHEAGFYVGDSPDAATIVRDDRASGNEFGIFIRHARGVLVRSNTLTGNCEGILVLDDGQRGGAGDAIIRHNGVFGNNKFCPKSEDTPVSVKGGGILLLGAVETRVTGNSVAGNAGRQFNSGGIVVLSARSLTHGSNPNHDTIVHNTAFGNRPADLRWDGTGTDVRFRANHCGTSAPARLCR